MPTGTDYDAAVVLINRHEPEGEATARLLEIADEKGYDARTVEAKRGEHDAALSFRVPIEVAQAFDEERADRWPSKIENEDEDGADQDVAGVGGDGFAADQARAARAARIDNANVDKTATPARTARPGKAKE